MVWPWIEFVLGVTDFISTVLIAEVESDSVRVSPARSRDLGPEKEEGNCNHDESGFVRSVDVLGLFLFLSLQDHEQVEHILTPWGSRMPTGSSSLFLFSSVLFWGWERVEEEEFSEHSRLASECSRSHHGSRS